MKKILLVFVLCAALSANAGSMGPIQLPSCLQDQYGNQYSDLVADTQHNIITGKVTNNQNCGTEWYLIGSWHLNSKGKAILELTAANTSTVCIPMYTLKGEYPSAYWNYISGYGGQRL